MKVRAIKDYYDLELKKTVKIGEEITVSAARGKALTTKNNKAGYALCEIVEADAATTPTTEEVAEAPKKKRAAKKTTDK
jgi:hypothetical protein